MSGSPKRAFHPGTTVALILVCVLGPTPSAAQDPAAGLAGPVRVTDDAGREVVLPRPAARVVSAVPSVTDLVLALGAADRLVGRTVHDVDPRLADLPSVGSLTQPELESLIALRPDLVLVGSGLVADRALRVLDAVGIPVYIADVRSIAAIHRMIRHLGVLLGVSSEPLSVEIDAGLAAVERETAGGPAPTVMYVLWHDPPWTAGAGTFIDTLIEVAGGRNAFGDIDAPWIQVALEEVIRRDPEILVLPGAADPARRDRLRTAPGWRELGAVRAGRVIRVDPSLFDRPGPRVADAARSLARQIRRISPKRVP